MKKILLMAAAALTLSGCGSQKKSQGESKILVLYYSQTETTRALAEEFQKQLGADIEEIQAVNPYDGDFQATIQRGQEEINQNTYPEIKPLKVNVNDYDVIFLGFPVWFGTYANPVITLVKQESFAGKKVVPFCTFGSGGLNTSAANLKRALPEAKILEGYGVRQARMNAAPEEVELFLKQSGFIEGEVPALPEFSEQKEVSEEELAIFHAACDSYSMPLGVPATAGSRKIENGTEYKFNTGSSTIYVIAKNGAEPEFTQVVR